MYKGRIMTRAQIKMNANQKTNSSVEPLKRSKKTKAIKKFKKRNSIKKQRKKRMSKLKNVKDSLNT